MEFDEEGQPMFDEFDEGIDGGGRLFESNKKLSFYIIDGGAAMLEPHSETGEPPFTRAAKAVAEQVLKVGCSSAGGLHHMVSVIVANTASSKPESGLVQHFHEVLPLDFVSGEAAVTMKELGNADDISSTFDEQFGGHATADLAQIIYYVRKMAKRKAKSARQLAVYYITASTRPCGEGVTGRAAMNAALKNIADLRDIDNGEFTCLYIGEPRAETEMDCLQKLDPNFSLDSFEELETIVYQKAFAPRAYSILPFEIAPGVQLDVGLFTLAAETKRPTPKWVDAETEKSVQSRTVYKPKAAATAEKAKAAEPAASAVDDDEFTEKEEEQKPNTSGVKPFVVGEADRARSELKQAIELGGEKIVFSQEELAKLKRFRKGLVLLGFKPIANLRVDRHVEAPRFIYPNEKTTEGSRKLFRALLERCSERKQMIVCYLNTAAHTRPRLVTLVPSRNSDSSCDGFHVVQLPLADDCVDGSEIDKAPKFDDEESEEQRNATRALVRKLTAKFEPFENPNLQRFYSMLIEYATGDDSRVVEDGIKPYFSNEKALARVQPQLDAVVDAFGDLSGAPAKAKRGPAETAGGAAPKRGKAAAGGDDGGADLEAAAKSGKLSSWTIPQLKAAATERGISLGGAKKKDEVVNAIENHYGV
uniref:Ku domain-containing protein n=1 Tax=Pristionchus pacificus TaxID=54126 RepID=A0A8R1U686_PRIPA